MAIDWFPLWLSLRVAAVSTAIAVTLGLWIAWLLAKRSFRGKEVVDAAITLPLGLPPPVLGYYLLVVLGRLSPLGKMYEWVFGHPLVFTWQAAVVAALFHATPLLKPGWKPEWREALAASAFLWTASKKIAAVRDSEEIEEIIV